MVEVSSLWLLGIPSCISMVEVRNSEVYVTAGEKGPLPLLDIANWQVH